MDDAVCDAAFDAAAEGKAWLSPADLQVAALEVLGHTLAAVDLDAIVKRITGGRATGEHRVNREQFKAVMRRHAAMAPPHETSRHTFDFFDLSGHGCVIPKILNHLGHWDRYHMLRPTARRGAEFLLLAPSSWACPTYRGAGFRYITLADFRTVLRQHAPGLQPATVDSAFRELDVDADGMVSFADFDVAMREGDALPIADAAFAVSAVAATTRWRSTCGGRKPPLLPTAS